MKIQYLKIADLIPSYYNPRKISRDAIEKLKRCITEFDLVDPIIVNKDRTIIGGRQRWKACKELKRKEAPCIVLDLPKDKERILNLALNKISG